jgi:hypothetical protein
MAIWYILRLFGILFPVLVFWTKKNLATLVGIASRQKLSFPYHKLFINICKKYVTNDEEWRHVSMSTEKMCRFCGIHTYIATTIWHRVQGPYSET